MADWSTLAQLYYGGIYNQLPSLTAASPGVQLERGVSDDLDLKAGLCTFRLFDPTDLYRPSNAASTLYGQTGPYMRGAFATGSSVRFTGEAQQMNPGQTADHRASGGTTVRGSRWVDVRLGGPLARVGQWRDTLRSALFTQISGNYATNSRGYWPLEDGQDSTSLANVSYPTRPGRFALVRLAQDGPAGAASAVELQSGGSLNFPVAAMSGSGGWQVAFASRIATVDATMRDTFTFKTTSSYTWHWQVNSTAYRLFIETADGTTVLDAPVLHGAGASPGQWIFTRFRVQIVGANVQAEVGWYSEAVDAFWGMSVTFAGSAAAMGAPTALTVPATAATSGASYSSVFVQAGVTDDLEASEFEDAFTGYRRERAGARFARLCASRGVPYVIRGTSSITAKMGAQAPTVFQDQLKEIRATERGLIFDRGDNIGIVLATRDYLYAQAAAPVLDLTWPTHFVGTLDETTAAADVANVITAENVTGSSYTAELATGRLGTQNPPTGSGRLDRKVDVNLASDAELADVASWWLAFLTQTVPRFDTVTIDVDAQPSLLTACNAAEPGMFVRITGRTPDPLLLLILRTAQKTNRKTNVFTFSVAAGDVFRVGVYDNAGSRYDSASTTLAAAATAGATSLSLKTSNYHDRWSTTAVPYALMIAGERVTCTAMTAATFSSGAWRQTATVTRAVNSVSKAQLIDAEVHLADPVYYG